MITFCSHDPKKYFKSELNGDEACFSNFYESVFSIRPEKLFQYLKIKQPGGNLEFPKRIVFQCVEQAMMYGKALLFGDYQVASEIIETGSPAKMRDPSMKCRELGRKVKGYNDEVWSNTRYKYVRMLVYEKFRQNQNLREILLRTGDYVIVEAAHYDKVWGVGLHAANPDIKNPDLWKGQNLLGQCLMDTRDLLRKNEIKKTGN
jgi:ribA/ribD-fused uncharacterized protein